MPSPGSPILAAALSLLFPGLGQAYAARPRRGLLLALPALALVGLVAVAAAGAWPALVGALVRAGTWALLLVAGGAFFLYHAAVIADAYRLAAASRSVAAAPRAMALPRRPSAAPLVALLAVALLVHGLPWWYATRAAPGLAALFNAGDPNGDWTVPTPSWAAPTPSGTATTGPTPSGTATTGPTPAAASVGVSSTGLPATPGGATPPPAPQSAGPGSQSPTPFAGPEWAADGQLNIVLIGSDEGPSRWSARPDAIFLLRVEIETARSALFAFPRYMSSIPMPPESAVYFRDGRYPGYINELYVAALNNPRRFPGNDARGWRVVAGAVQELAGVTVDHYVMVNLNGFADLVEAMGGLWVDIPEPGVSDDAYGHQSGSGRMRIRLRPGCRQLDGTHALAFARSRHQDSDIHRLGRQQLAIQMMRRQFDPLEVVPRLPELLEVAGDNFHWTLQPEDVMPVAELAERVEPDRMHLVIFAPPEYRRELNDERIEKIRAKVRGIFDEPEPLPTAAEDCPPAG